MAGDVAEVMLRATMLEKHFQMGDTVVHALRGIDIAITKGEIVAILGSSGSGKSTLLGILGGLDAPSAGRVEIAGVDITKMSENALAEIRNKKIGFVFQFFNLISTLTALENVELPIQFSTGGQFSSRKRAEELLELVGLKERLRHRPGQLSGGEQQRVAIARAMANAPDVILADEPTGNLDTATSKGIHQLLVDLNEQTQTAFVVVTHNVQLAWKMERHLLMQHGLVRDLGADEAPEEFLPKGRNWD